MLLVPPMLSIPNQLEGAYQGQDVTLECTSEAYPSSIKWVLIRVLIPGFAPAEFISISV